MKFWTRKISKQIHTCCIFPFHRNLSTTTPKRENVWGPCENFGQNGEFQNSRFPDTAATSADGRTLRSEPDPSPNAPKDQIRPREPFLAATVFTTVPCLIVFVFLKDRWNSAESVAQMYLGNVTLSTFAGTINSEGSPCGSVLSLGAM